MINGYRTSRAQSAADASREDTQDFNAAEAEKQREWEENMYNTYYSPPAMQEQYRSMGASDAAATMAALGVSPTSASGATASSTPNSPISPMGVNSLGQLFESLTKGDLNKSQKEGQDIDNTWKPRINQANIDQIERSLSVMEGQLDLSKAKFSEIEKPMAMSMIDKNQSEIDVNQERMKEIKANVRLLTEKVNTEQAQQGALNAGATASMAQAYKDIQQGDLAGQQARNQEIDNEIDEISQEVSDIVGFDVRLDPRNQVVYLGTGVARKASRDLKEITPSIKNPTTRVRAEFGSMMLDEFFRLYDRNADSAKHALNRQSIEDRAWKRVEDIYQSRTSKGYQKNHPDTVQRARKRYYKSKH